MATLLDYKVRIKEWEKTFSSKHGKPPSKSDVKADPEIRKAYKAYNELKKADAKSSKSANKPKEPSLQTAEALPSVDVYLTDEEEIERNVVVRNAELGPTPQANGKVMSLFDSLMSPPDSSPIRRAPMAKTEFLGVGESPSKQSNIFKTPTKSVTRIESTVTPSRSSSNLMERLRTAASPSAAAGNEIMQTPFYLGRTTSKFSFSDTQGASQESPSKASLLKTPEKPPSMLEEFQGSPSPLKSQRYLSFGGTKKVSQIFQEFQSLAAAQDFEAQKREIEEENLQVENLLQEKSRASRLEEAPSLARKRKKALTQKRTTRRWKIRPRSMDDNKETAFEGKDVHDEIDRLQRANHDNLEKYINGEVSDEVSTDEEDEDDVDTDHESKPILRNPNLSTKINPISNNYQRLKINDPRAKKFKQRMKRR